MGWLSPAFRPHPDIEALNDSGHRKFNSIDVKFGVAMTAMLRTRDRLDMIVSLDYLVKLQYQGGNKLHQFKETWLEILTRMRPEDVPSEKALLLVRC